MSEKSEQISDQSNLKWVKVSEDRFNFIKQTFSKNENFSTTIDGERYILNDGNKLVNKISDESIGKNNVIKAYNVLVNKANQIPDLSSTVSQQKIQKMFNHLREIFDWSDLKSEESAAQERNQQGSGLQPLTPNRMLGRSPTSSALLKAGKNSENIKNKIKQLLYSLYFLKKLTKKIYNNLINTILKWKDSL